MLSPSCTTVAIFETFTPVRKKNVLVALRVVVFPWERLKIKALCGGQVKGGGA